jgi:hypothetical protein
MMNLKRNVPSWITLPLLAAIVIGGLFVASNIKSYLDPISSLSTIYRPKPVPVKVETVKWLKGDVRIKRETITVPVEVIREVPAKVEKQLLGFGISLKDLHDENKELAKVVDVPKAPHGGEMALTVNTGTGAIEGIFLAHPAPLFELGGIREVGVDYEPLGKRVGTYFRQDLGRIGPAILNVKVFAKAPITPTANGRGLDYGGSVGVAVRF